MLRAIAHAVFRDHQQDQRCHGCLELAGFATMRGYAGNAEYPTCGEALGPNDAFESVGADAGEPDSDTEPDHASEPANDADDETLPARNFVDSHYHAADCLDRACRGCDSLQADEPDADGDPEAHPCSCAGDCAGACVGVL
jgi:hypothetical protein